MTGGQGPAPLADDARQACGGIGFDETVVDGWARVVELHFDDAEPDIQRVEQAVIAVLAAFGSFLRLADAPLVLRLDLLGLGGQALFEDDPVGGLIGLAGATLAVEIGQGAAVAQNQPHQGYDGDRHQQGQRRRQAELTLRGNAHQDEADERRQGEKGQLPAGRRACRAHRIDDLGPAADLARQDGGHGGQQQGQGGVQRHGLEHRNGIEVARAVGVAQDGDAGNQYGCGGERIAGLAQAGAAAHRQRGGDQHDADGAGRRGHSNGILANGILADTAMDHQADRAVEPVGAGDQPTGTDERRGGRGHAAQHRADAAMGL